MKKQLRPVVLPKIRPRDGSRVFFLRWAGSKVFPMPSMTEWTGTVVRAEGHGMYYVKRDYDGEVVLMYNGNLAYMPGERGIQK